MSDTETDPVAAPSRDGWPDRYFAVIFTAQRTLSDDDMYSLTADRMIELAQAQPGFLGVESVRGDDGIGITVSYWRDRGAIRDWRVNVEHLAAQQMGRQEFYSWYQIRVAEVVAHRSFDAGEAVDPGVMPSEKSGSLVWTEWPVRQPAWRRSRGSASFPSVRRFRTSREQCHSRRQTRPSHRAAGWSASRKRP